MLSIREHQDVNNYVQNDFRDLVPIRGFSYQIQYFTPVCATHLRELHATINQKIIFHANISKVPAGRSRNS